MRQGTTSYEHVRTTSDLGATIIRCVYEIIRTLCACVRSYSNKVRNGTKWRDFIHDRSSREDIKGVQAQSVMMLLREKKAGFGDSSDSDDYSSGSDGDAGNDIDTSIWK